MSVVSMAADTQRPCLPLGLQVHYDVIYRSSAPAVVGDRDKTVDVEKRAADGGFCYRNRPIERTAILFHRPLRIVAFD
jgi:hypothetical protein